ncbi:zinc finger protein 432-like isoform X1 [Pieris brassicae]|uniref:zinc finger protein 432-like isoform X1 n=1 Tax=Pieris brassicae TaxID=7116 RepID=UPI001E660D8D|nr:zinc finger protein 432-like isoform X1 [Pieris brassicae]
MVKANVSSILSNILNKKRYSHCRLCLGNIEGTYIRMDDSVSLNASNDSCQTLSSVLIKLLGEEFGHQIPGVDAVCLKCVDCVLAAMSFIENCKSSERTLKCAVNSISKALESHIYMKSGEKLFINLNNTETELFVLNRSIKKRKQTYKRTYECYECLIYLDTFHDLKVHNLAYHGSVTCNKCNKIFLNYESLSKHEKNEHKFICPECPHIQNSEEDLKNHHNQCHAIHICQECGKHCKGLNKLISHEDKHKTKNSCPKCGKSYTTKDFYKRHVKLCLSDKIDPHPHRNMMKKSYNCEKCAKGYSTRGGLRVHNRFAHGNAKPHICKECGKKFTAPSYLRVHMVKHTGERNFKCTICENRFVSKEALLYHTRRHTGEKPYSCNQCDERFVNASARAEHIKFKHVGPTLVCDICTKKFVTRHFLKQHIGRHHDPTSKLYYGRSAVPTNVPSEKNMRKFIIQMET